MIAGFSAAFCIAFARACAGVRCLPSMALEPRCSIDFTARASVGCGNNSTPLLRDVGDPPLLAMVDSTAVRAHRSAGGAKGGLKIRPSAAHAAVQPQKSMRCATNSAGSTP